MVKQISASELIKIAETQDKEKSYLLDIAKQMQSGAKIQARLSDTAKGRAIKLYTYDRYLYRFICSDIITIK